MLQKNFLVTVLHVQPRQMQTHQSPHQPSGFYDLVFRDPAHLPVVSRNLFFHLGNKIAFCARVLFAFLDSLLPIGS